MPTTFYDPAGVNTAGKSQIGVVTAIADIEKPTLTELSAGTAFECAIESFGLTISASSTSRKKLCDLVATKTPGNSEYDDLEFSFVLDDPQAATQPLLDKFTTGSTVYLYHRPGEDHDTAIATGDMVQVIKGKVMKRQLDQVTTDEGQEYSATVTIAPSEGTDILVAVVAGA